MENVRYLTPGSKGVLVYRSQIVRLLAVVIAVLLTATVNLASLGSVGESQTTLASACARCIHCKQDKSARCILSGPVIVYLLL